MLRTKRPKTRRKTPWDAGRSRRVTIPAEEMLRRSMEQDAAPRMVRFRLHGHCAIDPDRASRDDVRKFLWEGLRVLRVEARARGLSEAQVRKLLENAFDSMHDFEASLWATLKKVMAERQPEPQPQQVEALRPQPEFVWSERFYHARKAVEEFSKETHADY